MRLRALLQLMNTLHGIVAETGFRFTPVLIGEFILEDRNSSDGLRKAMLPITCSVLSYS